MSIFREGIFEGRVALVTGGGSGIGEGIARRLAGLGASVVITGRRLPRLETVAEEIAASGGECLPLAADVRDYESLRRVYERIDERFGRLDVLVNSAAGNFLAAAASLSANGFGTVVDIDLKGTFNASRAAFELLSKRGGAIVNISATLHYGGTPMQVHAASAKAGIDAMTRTLAVEWVPLGIRVNAVAPGPIADTEGIARLAPGEVLDRITRSIPLRRLGRIDEIASAVVFLASDASAWTTGSVLVVDGGAWLDSGRFGELMGEG